MAGLTLATMIASLFNRDTIQQILERLPDLATPAMDFLYPEASRKLNPLPYLSYKDFEQVGNIPLVKRGQQSFKLSSSGKLSTIEPQTVYPSIPLDAVDFNNLRMLDVEGKEQYIQNRFDQLRQATKLTAEAMCIQSVTGKISYPIMENGTKEDFVLDFGTPTDVVAAKKLDASGATVADLLKITSDMKAAARKNGYGRDVIFLAPSDVYAAAFVLVTADGHDARYDPEGNLILGNNTKIREFDYTYTNLNTGASVGLPAKKLTLWDRGAGNKLFYSAVDDFEANFIASPFWPKAVLIGDIYEIKGQSKPTPVVNAKSLVTSTVLA